ncbi:hypothetical protein QTQ03_28365 [Micromonospora sp. WMMA1363]|uniref:hypothetical protein n=1 Tax=Micromonospora sp. WMMA1363 TaxID=3053985 RepID=UPI00259C82B6|nr:hypothetical protein [Micromonospora sp. WMMA1363]MDM4723322.1 hypothetical protein [Micromonospora sp. WMMA1363]
MRLAYELWGRVLAAPDPGGGVQNPLDGVTPDLGVLGGAFQSTWVRVVGGLWALMIAAAAVYLGAAMLNMAQARRVGNAHMMSEAAGDVKLRAAALAGLVGLPVIVGAIITVVG